MSSPICLPTRALTSATGYLAASFSCVPKMIESPVTHNPIFPLLSAERVGTGGGCSAASAAFFLTMESF